MKIYTEIKIDKELPYNVQIHDCGNIVYGEGINPSSAIMAALSVGRKIPSGTRNRKEAVDYILTNYPPKKEWVKIMRMLTYDSFTVFMD